MTRLIGLKLIWLPRGTLSNMTQTIMILFLRWPRLPLFACFFLWLLCVHGPFFSWISRMLHGDLAEEVYMEQPLGYVAQGEFGLVWSKTVSSILV